VADALSAAHQIGVVHGRLSPRLVLVPAKVLGFGLPPPAAGANRDEEKRYLAPEQLEGVTATGTDVWAFGLVAFHAITGLAYVEGENPTAFARRMGKDSLVAPSFDVWMRRSVVRDAKQRFRSIAEAKEALLKALKEDPKAKVERTIALGDAAAAGVAQALRAKEEEKPIAAKAESTMTVGLSAAPGFSADELVAQHKAAKAAAQAADPAPREDLPPVIPMPRGKTSEPPPASAPAPQKSSALPYVVAGVIVIAATGFIVWKVTAKDGPAPVTSQPTSIATKTPPAPPPPPPPVTSTPSAPAPDPDREAKGLEAAKKIPVVAFTAGKNKFALEKTEVTVGQYKACVDAAACEPAGTGPHCTGIAVDTPSRPINCVDHGQAERYCKWLGRRLPTEAEWEQAARGRTGGQHPWGNAEPDKQLCWNRCTLKEGPCDVATFKPTAEGLADMAGNVGEWTASHFCPPDKHDCGEPDMVVRGGDWCSSEADKVKTSARGRAAPQTKSEFIGFRCASTP
jgi:formylglycine-generating enzyme required for sulfatase activity